jgi:hypothetical protein
MKRVIIKLLLFTVLTAFEVSLAAQSSLAVESNLQADSCKPIIPKDTVFYPKTKIAPGVFIENERVPEFPGGDEALVAFIKSKTIYPATAVKDSVSGRVVVQFTVGPGGCPKNFSILMGIRADLNNESIRVVKQLPKFKPGSKLKESPKGWYWTTVNVQYIATFNFRLKNGPAGRGILILPPEHRED